MKVIPKTLVKGDIVGFWYNNVYRKGEVLVCRTMAKVLTLKAGEDVKSFKFNTIENQNGQYVTGFGNIIDGHKHTELGI